MPKQHAADPIEQRISDAQDEAKRQQLIGTKQTREMRIERRERDDGSLELAFSSEAPVERWFGREILDHAPGAMRMARLSDGAPLLLQHDPDRQIGVIESARIDQDRIGRAVVRFSNSALGREIWQDVADGIRTKVSVGYIVHDMRLDPASSLDGDTYRVTDYEPLEISIVSIPADSSVGVGRNHPETVMPDDLNTPAGEAPSAATSNAKTRPKTTSCSGARSMTSAPRSPSACQTQCPPCRASSPASPMPATCAPSPASCSAPASAPKRWPIAPASSTAPSCSATNAPRAGAVIMA